MSDASRRVQRVQKELNNIIANYLRSNWKGPCPGLLSVAHVDVMPDMRSAKVFVSVISTEEDAVELFQELIDDQRGEIQQHLAKSLRMKFYPKLSFKVGTYGELPISQEKPE